MPIQQFALAPLPCLFPAVSAILATLPALPASKNSESLCRTYFESQPFWHWLELCKRKLRRLSPRPKSRILNPPPPFPPRRDRRNATRLTCLLCQTRRSL